MTDPARNEESPAQLRRFGFTAAALIVAIFGLLLPWRRGASPSAWPFLAALALFIPALVAPRVLAGPHRAFTSVGHALGWVNTRIILGLVYFLLLTPMALVMRWAGRDPLRLRFDPSLESYRVRSVPLPRERMEVPY